MKKETPTPQSILLILASLLVISGCTGGGTRHIDFSSSDPPPFLDDETGLPPRGGSVNPFVNLTLQAPPYPPRVNIVLLNEPEGDFIHDLGLGWLTWDGQSWVPTTGVPARLLKDYPAPWQRNQDQYTLEAP